MVCWSSLAGLGASVPVSGYVLRLGIGGIGTRSSTLLHVVDIVRVQVMVSVRILRVQNRV